MDQENNNLYNLFIKRKYKRLYNKLKLDIKLLNEEVINGETIIIQFVKINNIKWIKKILKLDYNQLIKSTKIGYFLPHYALFNNFYDLFFLLTDLVIEKFNKPCIKKNSTIIICNESEIIFNKVSENKTTMTLLFTSIVNDINLIKKFYLKYYKYIDYSFINNNNNYLTYLIYDYYDNLSIINEILEIIKKETLSNKIFEVLNNSDILTYIIFIYFKPEFIKYLDNKPLINYEIKNLTINDIKNFINIFPEQLNKSYMKYSTPITILTEINNLELLKFCIDKISSNNIIYNKDFEYSSLVMELCTEDIIEYVLKLNLNFNYINIYNETPIFLLIKNNNNISDNIIIKLLKKTNDWDLQNVYGESIIFLIFKLKNIENYYEILKTKYFNINSKNNEGISCLDLLKIFINNKYKLQKLSNTAIDNKIKDIIKLLLINNFYNKIIEYFPNIKTLNENDYITLLVKYIYNPLYTDLDNLSKDYQTLYIPIYTNTEYNLSNNRYIDIYIYIFLLLDKYNILYIPIDKVDITKLYNLCTIEKNDIFSYFNDMFITYNNISNYTIIIYDLKYWIPYNLINNIIKFIETGYKIIIVCIIIIEQSYTHFNILIIDSYNNRIIRFEPHGNHNDYISFDNKLKEIFFSNKFFNNYKYYIPNDYLPQNNIQHLSREFSQYNNKLGDLSGYCVAWCMWFIDFYITNINNNLLNENKFITLVPKLIKKLINKKIIFKDYIRNYSKFLHDSIIDYYNNNNIPLKLYYNIDKNDHIFDHSIIFNHINSKLNNLIV